MRLAFLASSRHPLHPPYAGGQEVVSAALVAGLRERGHHVVLYAPAGTEADLADELLTYPVLPDISPDALADINTPEPRFLSDHHAFAYAMADLGGRPVDAVLNHSLHQLPLLASRHLTAPVITTLHTPPFPWMELGAALAAPSARYVAVSEALAQQWSTLAPRPLVVHNGIDVADFPAGPGGDDLAWVGRITPEKGTHLAVAAARAAGRRLHLVGPVANHSYFANVIEPQLDSGVVVHGHLDHAAMAQVVGASAALLVTPRWDEPFGLVAAEAAACGTPVVAVDRGGVREAVGRCMGVIVPDHDDDSVVVDRMVRAIPAAIALERPAVRAAARRSFGLERMVAEHEAVVAEAVRAGAVRVQHIPAGHGYARSLRPPVAATAPDAAGRHVVTLPDPPVPGAPPGRWWPHPALEPGWPAMGSGVHSGIGSGVGSEVRSGVGSEVRSGVGSGVRLGPGGDGPDAAGCEVAHVHFGFEHKSPAELRAWTEALRTNGTALVVTVHDLQNPHLPPTTPGEQDTDAREAAQRHRESLGVLLQRASRATTLTAGAAREVREQWGVECVVHPHPHVVAEDWLERPRTPHEGFVVSVHLKSLRANVDLGLVLDQLVPAVRALGDATLRVHVHDDVSHPDDPGHDPRLADLARAGHPVDLRVHGELSDEQLWADLLGTDLAVLPYRAGTHSGWLEMCHDLGTDVLVPDLGHFAEQRPVRVWARAEPGSLAVAVRSAFEDHRAGVRPARPSLEQRRAERLSVAEVHRRLHLQVAAEMREGRS